MTTATATPAVQIGDMFECNWGYDQTNIDFYKVLSVSPSGKTVQVQRWASRAVGGDRVVPGGGPVQVMSWVNGERAGLVDEPVMTRRIRMWSDRPTFSVNDYSSAYAWDGRAAYETPVGAGH